jgi:hypothetical protein
MQETSGSLAKSCPQCGASVELPPEQISSLCAFCESPLVAASDGSHRMDRVAPFDLNKVQAGNLLAQHLQERRFIPTALRFAGQPENLRGVLVPFWCYDATTHSSWQARQGIHWYRTETYTTTVNGKKVTRTRQVKETEWFDTSGSHVGSYDDHLVSGSRGLSEPESNALEPFDLGRSLPYSPALLAGWTAERPTVPKDVARATANQELANVENRAIRDFLPADRVSDVENQTSIQVSELELVMLPVWVGTYRHKDSVLRLLVNGQTGEVVADLPTSWAKVFLALLGGFLLLGAGAGILALLNGALQ